MSAASPGMARPSLALSSAAENDGNVAVGSLGDGEATIDLEIFIPRPFPMPREFPNPKLVFFPGLSTAPNADASPSPSSARVNDVVSGRDFLGRPGDHNTPSLVAKRNWGCVCSGLKRTTSLSASGKGDDEDDSCAPRLSIAEGEYLHDVIDLSTRKPCRSVDSIPANDIDCQNAWFSCALLVFPSIDDVDELTELTLIVMLSEGSPEDSRGSGGGFLERFPLPVCSTTGLRYGIPSGDGISVKGVEGFD